jgi:hypothetical protein
VALGAAAQTEVTPNHPAIDLRLRGDGLRAGDFRKSAGRNELYYPEDRRKRGPFGFVALGAGVLAGGAGAYFGMKNLSATSEWRAATAPAAITEARNRAKSAATLATIAWVAGGVLASLGAGLILFTDF